MRTLTEHAQRKFHVCSLFLIDLITVSLSPPTQRLNQLFTYEDSETVDVLATRGRKPRSLFTPHSSHSLMILI